MRHVILSLIILLVSKQGLSDKYCNGAERTSNRGTLLYPNGKEVYSVRGALLYPNGNEVYSSRGTIRYLNGNEVYSLRGTLLYPNGKDVYSLRGTPLYPNGNDVYNRRGNCVYETGVEMPSCPSRIRLKLIDGSVRAVTYLDLDGDHSLENFSYEIQQTGYSTVFDIDHSSGEISNIDAICE